MEESMKINSGAVLSSLPDDAHVLAVDSGGGLRRLTPSGLRAEIKSVMGVSVRKQASLAGGEWVRVARADSQATFCAILTVTHVWKRGKPVPLVCFINGSSGKEEAINACLLSNGPFFAASVGNGNLGASFTDIRFVSEDTGIYIEVKFCANSEADALIYSLCGQINVELTDATVSTATVDKVLKTIDLRSGGVMRCITVGYDSLCAPRQKGGHHDRGYEDSRLPEVAPGGCLSFESLDSLCDFIGRASEEHDSHSDPDNSDMRRHERGGRGVHAHKHGDFEPPHERRRRLRADAPLRRCSQDADILWMGAREAVHAQEELISGRQFMGCLEGDSVRVIAGRKEVAYV